ncbi:hypothetical protein BDD12DRAFT_52422 [Trichophaea hybrida]|nr:hypothetical protein BDD12DRAFT_52422 [Trichophaea hybrida]
MGRMHASKRLHCSQTIDASHHGTIVPNASNVCHMFVLMSLSDDFMEIVPSQKKKVKMAVWILPIIRHLQFGHLQKQVSISARLNYWPDLLQGRNLSSKSISLLRPPSPTALLSQSQDQKRYRYNHRPCLFSCHHFPPLNDTKYHGLIK